MDPPFAYGRAKQTGEREMRKKRKGKRGEREEKIEEKGAFRRIAAPFIRDTPRHVAAPA